MFAITFGVNCITMNIDQGITNAFIEAVPGEGLFMVEGNPTTNVIRILPADKTMMDNLACLAWSFDIGFAVFLFL